MSLLGRSSSGAAWFWAAAIACFVAACAALGAVTAQRAAQAWAHGLDGQVTVRVLGPDRPGATEAATAVLKAARGVADARAMSRERAAELIGEPAQALPRLRLIEVELAVGGVRAADSLVRTLARAGFQAEVYGPGPWAEASAEAARRLALLALAAAALCGGAAALITPLAARARARQERLTLLALFESGAAPGQAFGAVARRAALEGLGAGLLGAAAAAALGLGLIAGGSEALPPNARLALISPADAGMLLAIALLAGLLAGAGARVAAKRVWLEAEGRA